MAGPAWTTKALGAAIMTTFVLLIVQLITGAETNVLGPSTFTDSTMFPALTAHLGVGILLGVFALVGLVLAALTREMRLIGPALLALVFIGIAAVTGQLFLRTSGNPSSYSLGMAVAFVVAFVAEIALAHAWTMRRRAEAEGTPGVPSSPAAA